jgi:hypothetical protein
VKVKRYRDWIHLAQDRVESRARVNRVMNFLIYKLAGNFMISLATVSFSRRDVLYGVNLMIYELSCLSDF